MVVFINGKSELVNMWSHRATPYLFIMSLLGQHCQLSLCGVNLTVGSCVIQYLEVCASNFVKFYISTSDYPEKEPYVLTKDNTTLPPWIASNNDYKLVIHGYGGGIEFKQTKEIQKGDCKSAFTRFYKLSINFRILEAEINQYYCSGLGSTCYVTLLSHSSCEHKTSWRMYR